MSVALIKLTQANRAAAIREAVQVLRRGGLIVMPTDTVYGLAAEAGAAGRIFEAKGREQGKPIPLLASDPEDVRRLAGEFGPAEEALADAFWPGPLTLVVTTPEGTEGCRVPDHDLARDLIRAAGGLLRVTSANRSGEPPALTAGEACRSLGGSVDLILDGGPVSGGVPSTVVRVEKGTLRILREGALSREQLMRAAGGSCS